MDFKESLMPDLAQVSKVVRKRRAPKHDFKDGGGRVFAHRHDNGGGWVADTARVAASVKVTRNAQVAQFARVEDNCNIEGKAIVTGHARLSGHVRVAQNARVDGNARLCDRAVVLGNSVVRENALVAGSSTLENNAAVRGWAHVINTRINGPRAEHFWATVSGSSRLMDSNLWGVSVVGDNAILHRTTMNNALVNQSARLLDSSVATTLASPIWAAISRGEQPSRLEGSILDHLTVFQCTLVRSVVNTPRCLIGDSVHFIGCRIVLHTVPFQEWNNEIYINVSTNDPAEVMSYSLQSRGRPDTPNIPQQRPGGLPAVASVGVVHNPETIRQRRIMRLERNES